MWLVCDSFNTLHVHNVCVWVYEWSAKVKCAYQLDGDVFVVIQVLPCNVCVWGWGEREREKRREKRREREKEREREKRRERERRKTVMIRYFLCILNTCRSFLCVD